VLMSVLLTPAARTSMSTSPLAGRGTGQSVRYSNFSKPPCPVRITAAMLLGIKVGSFLAARDRHASDIDHDVSCRSRATQQDLVLLDLPLADPATVVHLDVARDERAL